jgi:magnesium transporter
MNESKPEDRRLKVEQMSMIILKNNVLLTFQERPGDAFDPIRERLKNPKARFYKFGIDYLAYAIMDAVVDDYLAALDYKSETLERLEKLLIKTPNNTFLTQLYELKRFLLNLTKVVRPLREIVNSLQHTDSPLLSPEISVFLRDLYDHALRILETTDNYREISTNMQDIYLSGVNLKMNETMKILTIFASIFIPLTFVASIYGMNFVHMPELQWKYGYYMVLGIMVCIASGLLLFFKKKKWF